MNGEGILFEGKEGRKEGRTVQREERMKGGIREGRGEEIKRRDKGEIMDAMIGNAAHTPIPAHPHAHPRPPRPHRCLVLTE